MINKVKKFINNERGQDLAEYILLAIGFIGAVYFVHTSFGTLIGDFFDSFAQTNRMPRP